MCFILYLFTLAQAVWFWIMVKSIKLLIVSTLCSNSVHIYTFSIFFITLIIPIVRLTATHWLGSLQMVYSTWALYSSHSVHKNNGKPLFRCIIEMKEPPIIYSSDKRSGMNKKEKDKEPTRVYSTCYTGGIQYLKKGDFLYIKDFYHDTDYDGMDRKILMTPEASYWGAYPIK